MYNHGVVIFICPRLERLFSFTPDEAVTRAIIYNFVLSHWGLPGECFDVSIQWVIISSGDNEIPAQCHVIGNSLWIGRLGTIFSTFLIK